MISRGQPGRGTSRITSRKSTTEAQKDLAWVDVGNGVQLMRVQPLQYILPGPPQLVSVQPRVPRSMMERLPVLPMHSDSYNQQQFEQVMQIHREMERIEQSEAPGNTYRPMEAPPTDPSPNANGGSQLRGQHLPSAEGNHKEEDRQGGIVTTPPGSTGMPNLDSSNSTQELLQQAFTPISQPPIRDHFMSSEVGKGTPVPIPMHYGSATPTVAWHPVPHPMYMSAAPYSVMPATTAIHNQQGQLMWAPNNSSYAHPFAMPSQVIAASPHPDYNYEPWPRGSVRYTPIHATPMGPLFKPSEYF